MFSCSTSASACITHPTLAVETIFVLRNFNLEHHFGKMYLGRFVGSNPNHLHRPKERGPAIVGSPQQAAIHFASTRPSFVEGVLAMDAEHLEAAVISQLVSARKLVLQDLLEALAWHRFCKAFCKAWRWGRRSCGRR